MFADLKKYKADYSFLAAITLVFIVLFMAKRSEAIFLLWLTGGYGFSYILWGVWHHHRTGHLTVKVMLEYVLVVVLALAVVSTLLL